MLFRRRKTLPHLETNSGTYFVTFRLADSVPKSQIEDWKSEREEIRKNAERQGRRLTEYEEQRLKYVFSEKIEQYLDQGRGECWLKDPVIAQVVIDALKYFDAIRYVLYAWCVMPNHIHVVFKTISKNGDLRSDLIPILHSWKSFTSKRINTILRRQGNFWQHEYYDHLIRSDEEFGHCINYTLQNPVKAGLCTHWQQWPWTGCSDMIKSMMIE